VKRVLAVLVVGLLGGGVAAAAVRKFAPESNLPRRVSCYPSPCTTLPPVTETVIVPAAGQTLVSGTVQSFSADGAIGDPIPTPFTINAVERGAQSSATVNNAIVGGKRKTIYWDAGTPLPMSGDGALDLGPAHVDADAKGVTWTLAGDARIFKPGHYRITSPVAIGSGGLGTPSDSGVEFTADDKTYLQTTPGVVVHFDSPTLKVDGPGTLRLTGNFTLRTASGTRTATTLTMAAGPFRVTLAPGAGGVTVTATLQGPVTAK
jgi:hypothetical protein